MSVRAFADRFRLSEYFCRQLLSDFLGSLHTAGAFWAAKLSIYGLYADVRSFAHCFAEHKLRQIIYFFIKMLYNIFIIHERGNIHEKIHRGDPCINMSFLPGKLSKT